MAEITTLDALQAFHQELLSIRERRVDGTESLNNEFLVQIFEKELEKLWSKPARNDQSRNQVKSGRYRYSLDKQNKTADKESTGKILLDSDEYSVNENFQQNALMLADEVDLDELEASRCLLESQDDPSTLGRSLLECGIIRFHQQRKYVLDAVRLLLELDGREDELEEAEGLEGIKLYVAERLLQPAPGGATKRIVPRCMAAMKEIKLWLQKLADKIAAAQTLGQAGTGRMSEEMETVEFSRVSLIQQHELLAVILCRSVEMRQASTADFEEFISTLGKADKYDALLGMVLAPTRPLIY